MKIFVKDVLIGIVIILLTMIAEFVVTLPFDEVAEESNRTEWAALINRELLLAALPTGLITFIFAWLRKTKSKKEAVRRGCIWGCLLALFYILIGINNGNIALIFGTVGIYALVFFAFSGPVLYATIKRESQIPRSS